MTEAVSVAFSQGRLSAGADGRAPPESGQDVRTRDDDGEGCAPLARTSAIA